MGAADTDAIVAWLRIGGLKVSIQAFLIGALCSSFARTVYLPKPMTSGVKAEGRFGKHAAGAAGASRVHAICGA
jgi:hypothetical protein